MTVCQQAYAVHYWLAACADPAYRPLQDRWERAFRMFRTEWWAERCEASGGAVEGGSRACEGGLGEPELAGVWLGPFRPLGLRPCRGCGVFWPCYSESCSFARTELCFHCTYLLP